MSLKKLISLERVRIIKEFPDSFQVAYGRERFVVDKDSTSHWSRESPVGGGMSQKQRLEQRLEPLHGIFLDKEVPREFLEVMIFHEFREKEYAGAGFDDAHQ